MRCFVKKGILRNFAKFIGKHLCQPATLSKKRLWHKCFLVNFSKFLIITFPTEQFQWQLLNTEENSGRRQGVCMKRKIRLLIWIIVRLWSGVKTLNFVLLSTEESFFDNEHVFLIINSFSKQSLSILHLNIWSINKNFEAFK